MGYKSFSVSCEKVEASLSIEWKDTVGQDFIITENTRGLFDAIQLEAELGR